MNRPRKILNKIALLLGYISMIIFAILSVLILVSKKGENDENKKLSYKDGPYIFYINDSIAKVVNTSNTNENDLVKVSINEEIVNYNRILQNYDANSEFLFNHAPKRYSELNKTYEFNASKIAAISDIHGSYNHFVEILKSNGIINDSLNWIWNNGHLVIVGDVIDKGPHVTECLWMIKKLEIQAEKYKGKVHFLLGNHEIQLLSGSDEYTGFKYRRICNELFTSYDKLFGLNTELGRWLRSKNIVVKVNGILFVHGGISKELLEKQLSINSLNLIFSEWLNNYEMPTLNKKTSELLNFLTGGFGPLEYRGYFNYNILNRGQSHIPIETINRILEKYQCSQIVVGHTVVKEIKTMFDNKIIAIDCKLPEDDSLKDDSRANMLLFENGHFNVAFNNQDKVAL